MDVLKNLLENAKGGNEDQGMLLTLIKNLEQKTDNKFENVDKLLEELRKKVENLTREHDETVKKVTNNKEQIDILFGKLGDIVKNYQVGDKSLQEQIDELRKYIDEKLLEINAQLELLSSNPGAGGGKIGDGDLKIISDLIKRITLLEKNFNELMRKTEEIVKEVDEIRNELKNKASIDELEAIKKRLDDLQRQLDELRGRLDALTDKVDGHDKEIQSLKDKIRELNELFNKLKDLLDSNNTKGSSGVVNIDMSKYVLLNEFNDYKNEANDKFTNINEEIEKIHKLIEKILEMLNNKADKSDLEELREFLLSKIDELAIACNKKFADKNETAKNFKYLESQIKKILAMLEKKDIQGDNWLLAKKPLNGFSCASCEAYIGELRDNTQYVPWNKYPLRDPNEKLYRIGNGFSKMLQMLNVDGGVTNNNTTEGNNTIGNKEPGNQTSTGFYQHKDFGHDIDKHKNNRGVSANINKVKGLPKVYGQNQHNNNNSSGEKKELLNGSARQEDEDTGPHM